MQISQRGIDFIQQAEGSEPRAYRDIRGFLTIGVGHMLTHCERCSGKIVIGSEIVCWRDGLSEAQIDMLLLRDLSWVSAAIGAFVRVPLTQGQYDALASLVFNIGSEAFRNSTLVRLLNAGDYNAIPEQILRWHYAAGEDVKGLIDRREREVRELWLS